MADNEFDILVLGGGSAGYAAALRGVQLGFSVALIEKSKLGGTCLHWGCIPTKAYLHSAELATEAQNSEKYGVSIGEVSVDMAKVREYKDSIVAGKYKGLQGLMKSKKVTVVDGFGKLTGENTIDVDGTTYTGKHIILASGSYSKTMGIEIRDRVMTSTEALEIDWTPKSAIVLGGGVIGSEFASMWNSFGVDVTVIEGLDHLVP
ncbi:FAD-dependent oxidoreductase, partial [Luteolibacter marinus]